MSIWLTDYSINSEILCVSSGSEFSLGWALPWSGTVVHLAGKALSTRYPAPAWFSLPVLWGKCQAVCLPFFPSPAESLKPQWSGTHEVISHCQVKCTLDDREEQWGAGIHCYRMPWALVTPEVQAAFSWDQNIAPHLECQDTQGSPISAAASTVPAASRIYWLSAMDMKSLCLPAHKGLVGCIWPQARLPLCYQPHFDLT